MSRNFSSLFDEQCKLLNSVFRTLLKFKFQSVFKYDILDRDAWPSG